mmetsp:Transcript_68945/g.152028  ORF Transcript_68945/g.152028 Transcript_68945/m.152028 type:complete len:86 (+) Transcript_68945:69-326(+)
MESLSVLFDMLLVSLGRVFLAVAIAASLYMSLRCLGLEPTAHGHEPNILIEDFRFLSSFGLGVFISCLADSGKAPQSISQIGFML